MNPTNAAHGNERARSGAVRASFSSVWTPSSHRAATSASLLA